MQFVAKTKFVPYSAFKLRPLADLIRGKDVQYALNWLAAHENKRVRPIKKLIESAAANAKHLKEVPSQELYIKKLCIDQGPSYKYINAGAMGRGVILRKRYSHLSVVLESKQEV